MTSNVNAGVERFYLAILDVSSLGDRTKANSIVRTAAGRKRLGYLFEHELPEAIEQVATRYVPLDERHVLACGMNADHLRAELERGAEVVAPSEFPGWITEGLPPDSMAEEIARHLNLAVGAHVPPTIARRRARFRWLATAACVALAVFAVIGLERRRAVYVNDEREFQQFATERLRTTFPDLSHPDELTLVAALRRAERQRDSRAASVLPPDAARSLAGVLAAWPRADVQYETREILATGSRVDLVVHVPTDADADAFRRAIEDAVGWSVQVSDVRRSRDGIQMSIALTTAESVGGGGGSP